MKRDRRLEEETMEALTQKEVEKHLNLTHKTGR